MKFVLCGINAKYIHTNIAIRLIQKYTLKETGLNTYIYEYTINNHISDILNDLYEKHPDVLCFSCYIWNIEIVKKLCDLIKLVLPNIIIILGGPEVSYNPTETLLNFKCNYVISGEGEVTFSQLAKAINDNKSVEKINGITYHCNGKVTTNYHAIPIDMALLPFPYDDFDSVQNKICYYEASRGCPFSCSYCLSSIEKGVRFAPIEKVKNELLIFINNKVSQVKFVDRTFNCNKTFANEIIKFIIQNDNKITNFHFEVESRLIDEEMLNLLSLARNGLFQLEIGVQSTNTTTLKAVNRVNDLEYLKYCMQILLKNKNVHIHLDLIAGLPFEDFESFRESFNDVYLLKPHQLQLGFLKILKGSSLQKLTDIYSLCASIYPPYEIVSTNSLSFDDILALKGVEDMTETYYNSNRYIYSIEYLQNFFETPFDLFKALSDYKKEKDTGSLVHNKQYTYIFLVDFATEKIPNCNMIIFKSKLKLDYLLHEKPRSIPDWCINNLIDKNEIYDIIVHQNKVLPLLSEYCDCDTKQLIKLIHIEIFIINPFTGENDNTTVIFNYRKKDILSNATPILLE